MEKKCSKCGEVKNIDEFKKDKRRPFGVGASCKDCCCKINKVYIEGNRGLIAQKKKEYKKVNKDKIKEYNESSSAKKLRSIRSKNYSLRHPDKHKAVRAVGRAVKSGCLIKPNICSICGDKASTIEGHHWSYKKEHWLDVVWCCRKCHSDIHNDLIRGE